MARSLSRSFVGSLASVGLRSSQLFASSYASSQISRLETVMVFETPVTPLGERKRNSLQKKVHLEIGADLAPGDVVRARQNAATACLQGKSK